MHQAQKNGQHFSRRRRSKTAQSPRLSRRPVISDAIEVDVGCPVLGYGGPKWPVTDGNHRLAAAIVRNDAFISVDVAGQLDHAASLLGVSERALMRHPDADAQETKRTLQDAHAHD
jgi:hypothetical protein